LIESTLFDCYDAFILDMDGTLTRGMTLLPEAVVFLRAAWKARKRFVILTDNSTISREDIAALLRSSGIPFAAEQVVTSSHVAGLKLLDMLGPCRAYLIGEQAFAEDLRSLGHQVVPCGPADAVVVGFTESFCYATLAEALPVLVSGVPLLVSDEAPVYAAPMGTMPGAGSIVGAFRGMGYAPTFVAGKPRGAAVDLSLDLTGSPRERVALIGDSLSNDGAAAAYLGISFVLVLTGVSSLQEAQQAGIPPEHVYDTLANVI